MLLNAYVLLLSAVVAPLPRLSFDGHGDALPPGAVARLGTTRFRLLGPVRTLGFAADNRHLLLVRDQDSVERLDPRSGTVRRSYQEGTVFRLRTPLALSADGKTFVHGWGRQEKDVQFVDAVTGQPRGSLPDALVFPPVDGAVSFHYLHYCLSHDARLLAVAGQIAENTTQLAWFDVPRGKQLRRVNSAGAGRFTGLAFSRNGAVLAAAEQHTGEAKARVRLWETAGGKELKSLDVAGGAVGGMWLLPDGKSLLVHGPKARYVSLYDTAAGKEVRRFSDPDEGGRIDAIALSPDGKTLYALGAGRVLSWDVGTGKPGPRINHPELLSRVTAHVSPDGKTLAAEAGYRLLTWDLTTGRETYPASGHTAPVRALAFSPTGKQLAATAAGQELLLWDLPAKRARALSRSQKAADEIWSRLLGGLGIRVYFSGDAKRVLVRWPDSAVRAWDPDTGRETPLPAVGDAQEAVALSPDGRLLAWAANGEIKIADLRTGKEVRRMAWGDGAGAEGLAKGSVAALAFSPDGKSLAGCGIIGRRFLATPRACVWEIATGQERLRLRFADALHGRLVESRHESYRDHAALRIDYVGPGRTVAVIEAHGTHLADAFTGKELRHLTGPLVSPQTVVFSPDGRLAAGGQSDGSIRFWRADTGAVLGEAYRHQQEVTALAFSPDGKYLASGSADTTILIWDVEYLVKSFVAVPRALSAKALELLWADLGAEDSARACRAVGELASAPAAAVPFLKGRLSPAAPLPADTVERLVADLASDRFAVRDRATRELERLDDRALPALEKLLAGEPPLEVRQRAEALLAKLTAPPTAPEVLRTLRAVEALEQMGTAEARAVLRTLAAGASDARLTREAGAAVRRLNKRPRDR